MFLSGLQGQTTALMSLSDPETLDEAITAARKVEAGDYSKKEILVVDPPTNFLMTPTKISPALTCDHRRN